MSVLHDRGPGATRVTQQADCALATVERVTDLAMERIHRAVLDAERIPDLAERQQRLSDLYEREARWWAVLARHCDPALPYLRALLTAQAACKEWAYQYRCWADAARRRGAA